MYSQVWYRSGFRLKLRKHLKFKYKINYLFKGFMQKKHYK